jgi:polyisoprenoid-binding protein YceI
MVNLKKLNLKYIGLFLVLSGFILGCSSSDTMNDESMNNEVNMEEVSGNMENSSDNMMQDTETMNESMFSEISDGVYNLVTSESQVNWHGVALSHDQRGSVEVETGKVEVSQGKIEKGEIAIDMTTIKHEKGTKKLEDHLKSADFFDAANYPEAKFMIETVKIEGNKYTFSGQATIRGKTNPEIFSLTLSETTDDNKLVLAGPVKIDRTKYDVKFRSGKFFDNLGDELIKDEFELDLKLTFQK